MKKRYPSEFLNQMDNQNRITYHILEKQWMDEFAFYVGKMSNTLYQKMIWCVVQEPLEHTILLRTQFLAQSLVPNAFVQKFYELLDKYQYRHENEIIKCIKDLAVWHGEDNVSFWKKVPWIEDVVYRIIGNTSKVNFANREYSFLPANRLYAEEIEEIKMRGRMEPMKRAFVIPNGYNPESYDHLDYKCHFASYIFSLLHPNCYAVTAICPCNYKGLYWLHSYNLSQDQSSVIDLANGFEMPLSDYERLMEPYILCQTKGEELSSKLAEIEASSWPFFEVSKNSPLKTLAFYNYDSLTNEEREEKFGKLIRNLNKLK